MFAKLYAGIPCFKTGLLSVHMIRVEKCLGCSTAVITDFPGPLSSTKVSWLYHAHGRKGVHL